MLAVALLKKGFEVQLFERDVTAIRGEGKYRGPIQVGWCNWHVLSCSGCQIWADLLAQPPSHSATLPCLMASCLSAGMWSCCLHSQPPASCLALAQVHWPCHNLQG